MLSMTDRLHFAAQYLVNVLKVVAPKDSTNMAVHGIVLKEVSANEWNIVVGGEPAPYAVYTNEPWEDPKWKGAKNPNEGWIQGGIEIAKPMIQSILSGKVTREEIDELIAQKESQADTIIRERKKIYALKMGWNYEDI